ncbi:MAG: hypothetical protein WC707_01055 [Candidatus Babeliaceae bacterium]
MNNFKKNMLMLLAFCITAMPFAAQAATVLDVHNDIKYSIEQNVRIWEDSLKEIIKDKIDNKLQQDVDAIEAVLLDYKVQLAEQSKTCISDKKLRFFKGMTHELAKFYGVLTVLSSGMVIAGCAYPSAVGLQMIIDAMDQEETKFMLNSYDIETARFCGDTAVLSSIIAAASAFSCIVCETLHKKIVNMQLQRSVREDNIKVIDNLLAYLNYEKGVAAGAGKVL